MPGIWPVGCPPKKRMALSSLVDLRQAGDAQDSLQKEGAECPERADRPDHTVGAGMIGALVPAAGPIGVLRIFADGVEEGLVKTGEDGLIVLRHEEHLGGTLDAQLVDPLAETGGVGEVQVGVRLAAVAVAAGDQHLLPLRRNFSHAAVLVPAPGAVQLEGAQGGVIEGEEVFEVPGKLGGRNAVEIPQRVVEDDQHLGNRVQGAQQVADALGAGLGGAGLQFSEQFAGVRRGQVVHAEMELGGLEGDGPFQGDGLILQRRHHAQQHGGVDAVVIGERDHGLQSELLLDLILLDFVGRARSTAAESSSPGRGRFVCHACRPWCCAIAGRRSAEDWSRRCD